MDRFKAEARGEAGLAGGEVAAHSGPIEEQPATWKVASFSAIDTDDGRHHSHKQWVQMKHVIALRGKIGCRTVYPARSAGARLSVLWIWNMTATTLGPSTSTLVPVRLQMYEHET
jgi:hypothetical protein